MRKRQLLSNHYSRQSTHIKHILTDRQFECITKQMEIKGITVNTTVHYKHVPEVERYIRTIQERIRAMTNTLPFEQLPHQLLVEIAYSAVFWLYCFPHKSRIHTTLSLHTIVTGSTIDFNKHCKLPFRTFVQMQNNTTIHYCQGQQGP